MALHRILKLSMVGVMSFSCSSEKSSQSTSGDEPIHTGALELVGSIANAEDPDNQAVTGGQKVKVVRSDGLTVAETTTESDGSYTLPIAAGALIMNSAMGFAGSVDWVQRFERTKASAPRTSDYTFQLEAVVPNDGAGKALGVRRKLALGQSQVVGDQLDLGESSLKEISAIQGVVGFAKSGLGPDSVDVFIPGLPFFLRTGDEGAFTLTFVPAGTYNIRLEKGIYRKDLEVTVEAGKTLDVGDVEIAETDRNPLPLAQIVQGTWTSKCVYTSVAPAVDADNPLTGEIKIESLTGVTIASGDSCVFRTVSSGAEGAFAEFRIIEDAALVTKFGASNFFYNLVTRYDNNQITFDVDSSSMGGTRMIETWTRK